MRAVLDKQRAPIIIALCARSEVSAIPVQISVILNVETWNEINVPCDYYSELRPIYYLRIGSLILTVQKESAPPTARCRASKLR